MKSEIEQLNKRIQKLEDKVNQSKNVSAKLKRSAELGSYEIMQNTDKSYMVRFMSKDGWIYVPTIGTNLTTIIGSVTYGSLATDRALFYFDYSDFGATTTICTIPLGYRVEWIAVVIKTVFDAGTISVSDGTTLMSTDSNDPTIAESYMKTFNKEYSVSTVLSTTLTGSPTTGTGTIIVATSKI